MIKLNDIEKKNCFKTPPDYFSDLEKNIQKKLEVKRDMSLKNNSFELFRPYVYLATGIILLVVLIRVGLEVGIGDFRQEKHKTEIIAEDSYFDELYDRMIADESFVMTYILEKEEPEKPIDIDYLEDYLAQYVYELELYDN